MSAPTPVELGERWDVRPTPLALERWPARPPGSGRVCHIIDPPVWEAVRAHAAANPAVEVGGLLLGEVFEDGGSFLVRVRAALAAEHTRSSAAQLTFTAQTWLDLLRRRRAYPGLVTVGWYHTHPGLGVFLSGTDLFAHRSFFGDQPWYLAVVVDPRSGEQGVFAWEGDRVVRCPGAPPEPNRGPSDEVSDALHPH